MAKKQPLKPANAKPKPLPLKKEGNAFDKIMKENIEKIFRPFIEAKLGITLGKAIPLKEKFKTIQINCLRMFFQSTFQTLTISIFLNYHIDITI